MIAGRLVSSVMAPMLKHEAFTKQAEPSLITGPSFDFYVLV